MQVMGEHDWINNLPTKLRPYEIRKKFQVEFEKMAELGEDYPKYNFPQLSGIASGDSIEKAICSGLCEVIERDATMKWWLNGISSEILIEKERIKSSLLFYIFEIPSLLPTVAAFLWDDKNELCNVGFASRFKLKDAINKAKCEAIQLRYTSIKMLHPDDNTNKNKKEFLGPETYLKEFSPSRNYKEKFRKDYRDMYDLIHNTQYYLDPAAVQELEPFKRKEIQHPRKYDVMNMGDLVNRVLQEYDDIIFLDLTTEDIKKAKRFVVRVLVPGMIPNAPTAYPPLGMFSEETEQLNLRPLPHS